MTEMTDRLAVRRTHLPAGASNEDIDALEQLLTGHLAETDPFAQLDDDQREEHDELAARFWNEPAGDPLPIVQASAFECDECPEVFGRFRAFVTTPRSRSERHVYVAWIVTGYLFSDDGGKTILTDRLAIEAFEHPDIEVTTDVLRWIKLPRIKARALSHLRLLPEWAAFVERVGLGDLEPEETEAIARAAELAAKPARRGRKGYGDAFYAQVALEANALWQEGRRRDVVQRLAADRHCLPRTAGLWVKEARARNYLVKTTRGRADFTLGPALTGRIDRKEE